MPGPLRNPAKPSSRHRLGPAQVTQLVKLPAHGCDLPVPGIPAGREWTVAEVELWAELWTSPQATQWTTPTGSRWPPASRTSAR
ncbi:MAG: hypothetical protein M3Q39_04155 [Actinomycetota bacterium]|nr:hypothetical protein [Actinomycetota bacterium]